MKVKTKATLFIAEAGFIASLLFSIIVFYELIEQPFELLDTILYEEAYRTAKRVTKLQKETPSQPGPAQLDDGIDNAYWIKLYDQQTSTLIYESKLARTVNIDPVEPGISTIVKAVLRPDHPSTEPGNVHKSAFRLRGLLVSVEGKTFMIQIARPMEKLDEEIWELVIGIGSGLMLSTLVLLAVSRHMADKILQPVTEMQRLTKDVNDKKLSNRIDIGEGKDEFSDLGRAINQMLDRLETAFNRQRELLFDTSHELKTPLCTIRLAVDEIITTNNTNLSNGTMSNLIRLNHQVLRMEQLVKSLLNLSALEATTRIDTKPVHLTRLVSSLAEEYQLQAEADGISIKVHLPELILNGDQEKLSRAFSNLIDNAIKYNIENGWIEITGDQNGPALTITIANSGPGIPEDDLPKLFNQFYRVEKSRSKNHGGSGLGLAIVKKIIELHGGGIFLESRPGEYTRAKIILPLTV